MCARFLSHLLLLYIGRVHGTISGCRVLGEVHPVSAQNKSLISDIEVRPPLSKKSVSCELSGGGGASRQVGNLSFFLPDLIFYKLECTGGGGG